MAVHNCCGATKTSTHLNPLVTNVKERLSPSTKNTVTEFFGYRGYNFIEYNKLIIGEWQSTQIIPIEGGKLIKGGYYSQKYSSFLPDLY